MILLRWQVDPVLIGGIMTLLTCYTLAVGPLRPYLAPSAPFPYQQAGLFYLAMLLLYVVEGSPLHDLAELYLFSAHMLQHVLLSYLVAPLLLLGLPAWLLRPILLQPRIKPIARFLLHPLVAFLTFSVLFSLWHLPIVYEGALRNSLVHHSEHVLLLLISLMLWWPLFSPLPELPRLSYAGQLIYLFVLPIVQMPVFAAVTFADTVIYPSYAAAPRLFIDDPLGDQALGGAIMKVAGLLVFGSLFIFKFFRWYQQEQQANSGNDASPAAKVTAPTAAPQPSVETGQSP